MAGGWKVRMPCEGEISAQTSQAAWAGVASVATVATATTVATAVRRRFRRLMSTPPVRRAARMGPRRSAMVTELRPPGGPHRTASNRLGQTLHDPYVVDLGPIGASVSIVDIA